MNALSGTYEVYGFNGEISTKVKLACNLNGLGSTTKVNRQKVCTHGVR